MEEFINLLTFLIEKHKVISESWEEEIQSNPYNGNLNVCHILEDSNIIKYIYLYREYIALNESFQEELKNLNLTIGTVTRRVKDHNSIRFKLERYMGKRHGEGHVPIKKCLNDILGFRLIFNDNYEYEDIIKIVSDNFQDVKIMDRSNGDYKALHIYLSKDNKRLMWELQIWNKEDEETNLMSHHKYKQDYVIWEDEEKEE